ncbi:MAG TPA: FAD-dependent oxidoreductase [Rhizomicrobium sp.]|nr:FAD-dependent oxidoreductase [Rhizomicrobium sp.]
MSNTTASVLETRRAQAFPALSDDDVARLRRFGTERHYKEGDFVTRAGQKTDGLVLVLSGQVRIRQRGAQNLEIVIHGPGSFHGELAHLSGRPSLVDAEAITDVDAAVIEPSRLRDVMVQEADLGERIMRALILRRVGLLEQNVGGPVIIGYEGSRDVLRLEQFLRRNGHPFQNLDPATDNCAKTLVEKFHLTASDLPTVLCLNGELLHNPSESQLARCIGLLTALDPDKVYDVAIIGAGPAGLAAAVYSASEGLSVIALDCRAFGGQAGASARIENYLGFPTGISGMALMARAYNQAQKFGTEVAIPEEVVRLEEDTTGGDRRFILHLTSGERVRACAVVIASGAEYRRLAVPNLAQYEGSHVHYWASPIEARLCSAQEVALVGAGNSAGQAAVYLASHARKVWMIVRGDSLTATMSRYLCDRIAAQPNIEVLLKSEVTALEGHGGVLEQIRWRNRATGEETCRKLSHVFLFIGASPNTSWLEQAGLKRDAKGFVLTGARAGAARGSFETSLHGVFAIGDVRASSIKRVAASVGEGAVVVAAIHAYLADEASLLNQPTDPAHA